MPLRPSAQGAVRRASPALLALSVAAALAATPCLAAGPPVRAVVTDQSALPLPATFGLPPVEAAAGSGDFAFLAGGNSGAFVRRSGASSPVRILQSGDEVPGVAHSRIDLFTAIRGNTGGVVALQFDYFAGDTTRCAIVTYDGSSFTKVALASDVAPGGGGVVFGRPTSLIGVNDSGAVAFTAPLTALGAPPGTTASTTIYVAPAGGSPVKVAGPGSAAPGTGGGVLGTITALGFNNLGEVVFRSTVSGGTGGYGLFVASTSGLRKVVTNGDPNPFGGTFALVSSTSVGTTALVKLNNAGQVAFVDGNGIFLHTPESGLGGAVGAGTAAPAPLDARTISAVAAIGAFNDSGAILFAATLSGSTTSNLACLRFVSGSPLAMVAYKGQAAPGTSGQALDTFTALTMNNAGDSAFHSLLNPTAASSGGLFELPAGGSLSQVVLDGTTAPAGGTYRTIGYCRLAPDGSLYFEAYLRGGAATYGSFVAAAGGIQAVLTDLDPLPDGSRLQVRNLFPKGAGNHVGFLARRAGGHLGLFGHNTVGGITSRVFVDGDFVANLAAPVSVSTNFVHMRTDGAVVFTGTPNWSQGSFILFAHPDGTVTKIAGPGDPVPGTGATFAACSLPATLDSPMNDAGDIVFRGTYSGGVGLFVAAAESGSVVSAVRSGEAAPTGGTFTTSTFTSYLLNNGGQVAFYASTSLGTSGIFVVQPGSPAAKVVVTGDAAPGGGTFSAITTPAPASFNAAGTAVFFATLSGGAGAGLYKGTASAAPQAVAVNGTAAPSGGNYLFTSSSKDARINVFGDVLFQAPLSGAAGSGMFLFRSATGTIVTLALQGETAPGTSYPFGAIMTTVNNFPGENTALGPNGEAWFFTPVSVGGRYVYGLFRYRFGEGLVKAALRGEAAPGGLGGTLLTLSQGIGAGNPRLFFFRAVLTDGPAADAICATAVAMRGDLTGDGRVDLAVFRPSTGTWYIKGQAPVAFGAAGDIPVPADYNGDGRNEIAMFRPSTATWLVQGQADNAYGEAGDIPVPGDYNGDGAAEIAVFRPSTGRWYVRNEAYFDLGQPGDIPVPADYNGDGKTEAAVFRPSNGTWYVQGQAPVSFGAAGDIPLTFDVDGNGTSELAYFRPSTVTWGAYGLGDLQFGLPGDIPMLLDTAGDNAVGIVAYRPGNSTWYSLLTLDDKVAAILFGEVGDIPVYQSPTILLDSTPLVTTVLHDSSHGVIWNGRAPAGAVVHARAIVSGRLGTATGTVTFTWLTGTHCDTPVGSAGTVPLDANGVAHPSVTAVVGADVECVRAQYSGDGTYPAAESWMEIQAPQTPVTFTDDPLVASVTRVKAVHIAELRQQIDAVRAAQGLAGYVWTDTILTAAATRVRGAHLADLRAALDEVYVAAARTPPSYTDAVVSVGATVVKAVHLAELRAAVRSW
jgi:hypothetical protein